MTQDEDVNIFFTHLNPTIAAEFCCDAHVRKMVVESTQMLANAYHMEGAKHTPPPKADGTPYAKSHWNHPCAVWVREDFKHWDWLRVHAYGLAAEFKFRFGGDHACLGALGYMTQHLPLSWMVNRHFNTPPLAIPDPWRPSQYSSRTQISPIGHYRRYIREGKAHIHTWTKRNPPLWLIDNEKLLGSTADALVNACRVTCWDADDYRGELGAVDVSDDFWGSAKEAADAIANGEDAEGSEQELELGQSIFDKTNLVLLDTEPQKDVAVRALGRQPTPAEWQLIKWLATERVNGRDPLERPANWDFSEYRG